MTVDRYTRAILTVIAAALVYLCVLQTPWPVASAQYAARPGDPTGPAQVVVIGWHTADRVPVQLADSASVRVTGEVRVTGGSVRTRQEDNARDRVVLAGWENRWTPGTTGGSYAMIDSNGRSPQGLPVTTLPVR